MLLQILTDWEILIESHWEWGSNYLWDLNVPDLVIILLCIAVDYYSSHDKIST